MPGVKLTRRQRDCTWSVLVTGLAVVNVNAAHLGGVLVSLRRRPESGAVAARAGWRKADAAELLLLRMPEARIQVVAFAPILCHAGSQ